MNDQRAPLFAPNWISTPAPPAVQPLYRTGHSLHIDRHGEPIPINRCFKCNCTAEHQVRKTFTSNGGILRLLIVLQPLLLPILLPVYLLRHNRVSVAFGLCTACRERRQLGITIAIAFLIASVPFFVYGALTIATIGPVVGTGGAALLAAGLLTLCKSRHLADSKHVDDRWIVLKGGGAPFLEAIPQAPRKAA